MSRDVLISALAALGCHGLLLFGLRWEEGAVPAPVGETTIEVSLVASAPPSAAPTAVEPPAADPVLPPTPVPEPVPEPPVPEPMITPIVELKPRPEPKPRPAETPQRAAQRPAKPSAPTVTARTGAQPGSGSAASTSGTVVGDTKPRYRSNPRPEYPAEARRLRQQGRVVLEVEVNATGRPTSVALKRSSGFPALDAAALAAVRRWTFEPARSAGLPVSARVEVPVQFDLSR